MVVHVPTWSIKEWKETWTTIWNDRKLRLLPDRRTVILGYPYIRPSSQRCGLYVYREAIRAATLWSTKVSTPSVDIEIKSDCNYAIELLQNTLESWSGESQLDKRSLSSLGRFTVQGES